MAMNFKLLSVLVVDDHPHMRAILVDVLRVLGVGHILQAHDGKHALDVLRSFKPDIIITDWQMEPMDGLEMTARLRAHPKLAARLAPVILMTGYSAEARVKLARDTGITEFLAKPFTAEALANRMMHVIKEPRDFIVAQKYKGPDRRRKPNSTFKGPVKRTRDKSKAALP
jgi:two-component system, chemotaxis family, chemotaxis protein CheY